MTGLKITLITCAIGSGVMAFMNLGVNPTCIGAVIGLFVLGFHGVSLCLKS